MEALRVLTFNCSGSNLSALAPPGFSLRAKYAAIAHLVIQEQAQLVTLQEVFPPTDQVLAEELLLAGYEPCGSAESHCGHIQLWAHASLHAKEHCTVGPAAVASVPLPLPDAAGGPAPADAAPFPCIYFVGCHLEPFADGARMRHGQIEQVLRRLPPRSRLILAGDLNMRNSENSTVEAMGLDDAFRQLGSPRDANFSWNTTVNSYYGPETRRYTARYDRVYLRGLAATELRLIADQPVTPGRGDFLSDHFGLLADIQVLPPCPLPPPPAAS